MGDYATTTSFSNLLPNLLKGNTTTTDTIAAAAIAAQIIRAESHINTIISIRYSLPFTTVPPLVRTLAEDIACHLFIKSSYIPDGQNKNQYADSFKEAIETLKQINTGKCQLTLTNGSAISPISTSRYKSSTRDYAPIFELDTNTSWEVDDDRISDIGDLRA